MHDGCIVVLYREKSIKFKYWPILKYLTRVVKTLVCDSWENFIFGQIILTYVKKVCTV